MKGNTKQLIQKIKNCALIVALCPLIKALSLQQKIITNQKLKRDYYKSQMQIAQDELFDSRIYYNKQLEEQKIIISSLRKQLENQSKYNDINTHKLSNKFKAFSV